MWNHASSSMHWRDIVCWEKDWIEPVAVISRAGFKQLLFTQICIHPPSLFQHPQIVLWVHWTDVKYMTSWRAYNENDPIFKHVCFRMLFHDEAQAGRLLGQGRLLHQRLHPHHHPRPVVLQIRTRRKKRWSLLNLNICSGTSCWQKLKKIEIF